MAKRIFGLFLLIITILFTGCAKENIKVEERIKPVRVTEVKETLLDKTLNYMGIVISEEVKKIGFKSPGKIEKIFVEKGNFIEKGSQLGKLDTKDLNFAVKASKAQMDAAKAQYDKALKGATDEEINNAMLNLSKAKSGYDYTYENFTKIDELYKEGAISKNDFDKVKLELEIREAELQQAEELYSQAKGGARMEDKEGARANWEQAKTDYEYKKSMLEEATLISNIDGYVMDVLYKEGELVGSGYPVVIIRNENQVVQVGLSQEDVVKVSLGNRAIVNVDGVEAKGQITNISEVPDEQTRTYQIEIGLDNNKFKIGSIAKIEISIGEEKGILIPITAIMANGSDYVYIVNDGVIESHRVNTGEIVGSQIRVEGLKDGNKLVIENAKEIRVGDKVKVIE